MQRIASIWVCFTTQSVIQNGSVFRYQTHTSGHLYIGVAPPPPPRVLPTRVKPRPPYSILILFPTRTSIVLPVGYMDQPKGLFHIYLWRRLSGSQRRRLFRLPPEDWWEPIDLGVTQPDQQRV